MHFARISLVLLLALGGCVAISSSNPRPPASNTTIVVPPGSIVTYQ
jgi:hypothetical protein